MVKVLIIHFQPIEYYPPTHNFLKSLNSTQGVQAKVLTTYNGKGIKPYSYENIRIERLSRVEGRSYRILRLFNIILYNLHAVLKILTSKVDIIYFFETWSIFPAFVGQKLLSNRVRLFGHFHEYTSSFQLTQNETLIFRFLYKLENKIVPKLHWVSHTNAHRMELYRKDIPNIPSSICKIQPNYPPASWQKVKHPESNVQTPIKLVYVGSLSTKNMYLKEVVTWVENNNGKIMLDLYSINLNQDVQQFLTENDIKHTTLKPRVLYDELPEVLSRYDIGIVIYNGGNLNYVYNAPNKLFEYHVCGLDVWFSSDLKTSFDYKTKDTYPKIIDVDFKNLNELDLEKTINRQNLKYKIYDFSFEQVYSTIISNIVDESTNSKL